MSRIALAVLLAVVLVAAGCGSKSKTTSTSDWANGLCTAITTAASSLKAGNLTQQSVQSAADDAKTATDTLASDLKKLGKPDTEAGAQAKQDVDDLSTQIQDGVQTIQDTLNSASGLAGILSAVPTVTSSLQTMGNEISSTFTSLKQLDAKGELQTAFKQAPACKPYVS